MSLFVRNILFSRGAQTSLFASASFPSSSLLLSSRFRPFCTSEDYYHDPHKRNASENFEEDLIRSLAQKNHKERTSLFTRVCERSIVFENPELLTKILKAETKSPNPSPITLKEIFSYVKDNPKVEPKPSFYTEFMTFASKENDIGLIDDLKLLARLKGREDKSLFDVLLKDCAFKSNIPKLLDTLAEMVMCGSYPNEKSLILMSKGFVRTGNLRTASEIMSFLEQDFEVEVTCRWLSSLVLEYAALGDTRSVDTVVRLLKFHNITPDSYFVSQAMSYYLKAGHIEGQRKIQALVDSGKVEDAGERKSEEFLDSMVFDSLQKEGKFKEMHQLAGKVLKPGQLDKVDSLLLAQMAHFFSKNGKDPGVDIVWRELESREEPLPVGVYNTLLAHYAGIQKTETTRQILRQMELKKVQPDVLTFTPVLKLYANNFNAVTRYLTKMHDLNIQQDSQAYTALFRRYYKHGRVSRLRKLRALMVDFGATIDDVLGNELLSIFSDKDMVEEAEDVFEQMASMGVECYIHDFNNMLRKVSPKKVRLYAKRLNQVHAQPNAETLDIVYEKTGKHL